MLLIYTKKLVTLLQKKVYLSTSNFKKSLILMLTNRIGRSLVKRYLLHINNHERGDASREDNQHGDDVDHGVTLQLLPVVVVTCWAAVKFPVRSSVRTETDTRRVILDWHKHYKTFISSLDLNKVIVSPVKLHGVGAVEDRTF